VVPKTNQLLLVKLKPPAIITLADLIDRMDTIKAPRSLKGRRKKESTAAHVTALHMIAMIGRPPNAIPLEELIDIDSRLIAYLESQAIPHRTALRYVREKDCLLERARTMGWSSAKFAVRESWEPIKVALKPSPHGSLTIPASAIAHGIAASEFGEDAMAAWRQEMRRRNRSPSTIHIAESTFRSKVRKARLAASIPHLGLRRRGPTVYRLPTSRLTPSLRRDIEAKLTWKSAPIVEGREARFAIREDSRRNLEEILHQVCAFAVKKRGMKNVQSLREILIPEVLRPMVEWLLEVRKHRPASVARHLGLIRALLRQHPDFHPVDCSWLSDEIARLPREPNWKKVARKNRRSISYEELLKVPAGLEAAIASARDPLKKAWLTHDLLFIKWTLYHPWRSRNLRECRLPDLQIHPEQEPDDANLKHEPLPLDRRGPELADWARQRLADDPNEEFWQVQFLEIDTKGKHMIHELVSAELVELLERYLAVRDELVNDARKTARKNARKDAHKDAVKDVGSDAVKDANEDADEKAGKKHGDPRTLFLNRLCKAMTRQELCNLYARLTEQYVGRRATPHLARDSFAAHHLENGGTMPSLQRALWHRDECTTWRYCRRFNASTGAVALNRHLTALQRTQNMPSTVPSPVSPVPEQADSLWL